ncbi:hypothetical protein JK364_50610 [Streptomyces sp. 110]|uniref:Restriction endonuclease n=1 Tax=Streptomyces endocoffeicus TaxID=2898945 RepID=A0ABS1Q745_9ACTN|nr:hypothetical protein [Streptomyces endocoffeicus]MBL1120492.1 hypothetical protein [Streptomyces endocoffeicus]
MSTATARAIRPPAPAAADLAAAHGNRVTAFATARERRGTDQPCAWELVSLAGLAPEPRAAVAWIVAEAIMRDRYGRRTQDFALWRSFALGQITTLDDRQRRLLTTFATPVFKPQAAGAKKHHGVAGHVGEWLWYLLHEESPHPQGWLNAHLSVPKVNVNDGGADGLIIHRTTAGQTPELVFRLWEMKKFTGQDNSLSATVTGAFQQMKSSGDLYVMSISGWGDRALTNDPELGDFVASMLDLWIDGDQASGAGVSVATNTAAVPDPPRRAFSTAHQHLDHLKHSGQLEGLVIAIDDFEDFARHVQELVWSAL